MGIAFRNSVFAWTVFPADCKAEALKARIKAKRGEDFSNLCCDFSRKGAIIASACAPLFIFIKAKAQFKSAV